MQDNLAGPIGDKIGFWGTLGNLELFYEGVFIRILVDVTNPDYLNTHIYITN